MRAIILAAAAGAVLALGLIAASQAHGKERHAAAHPRAYVMIDKSPFTKAEWDSIKAIASACKEPVVQAMMRAHPNVDPNKATPEEQAGFVEEAKGLMLDCMHQRAVVDPVLKHRFRLVEAPPPSAPAPAPPAPVHYQGPQVLIPT